MNKSKKQSETADYKKLIKFPKALWESLEVKAKEENQDNMTEYIRYICREYLKSDGFKNRIGNDEEMIEPLDYEKKLSQVLTSIENQKLDFEDLHEATQISKEELVIILGNLVDSGQILYDTYWRYYKA